MRVLIVNGSPKARNSNTQVMTHEFEEGLREGGAETETVFLAEKNIGHCCGCLCCWTKTPGRCRQRDDMDELLPKVQDADLLTLATPLYVDHVTGMMKNFIDRLIPVADPHFRKDENNECRHAAPRLKRRKLAVLSNNGFPEMSHFQVLKLYFRRMMLNFHLDLVAEIYRSGGELLRSPSLWLKLPLMQYKHLLRKAGCEVASEGRLSEKTREELEKPLMPEEEYIRLTNQYFDKILKKRGLENCCENQGENKS